MPTAALVDVNYADTQAPLWLSPAESGVWLALAVTEKSRHLLSASVFFRARYACSFDVDETDLPDAVKEAVALLAFLDSQSVLQSSAASTTGGAVVSESKSVGSLKVARTYASGVTSTVRGRLGRVDSLLASLTLADGTTGTCRYRGGAQRIEARS